MTLRAGVLVTGTEVLTGIISDRNGPWLSERLREIGVQCAHILVVGDRPADVEAGLRFFRDEGHDLVVTSGGLGPTADDLTAEVVGRFQGREMVLDSELEERIAEILRPLAARYPGLDLEAVRESNRKQAVVPVGAAVLPPVGTAPGLVVPPADGADGPVVVVLPGPPRELQPMWRTALQSEPMRELLADAPVYRRELLRLFGIPESEIAATLRALEEDGLDLSGLEITTCLRRAEIEIATTFVAGDERAYEAFAEAVVERHADTLFSRDGQTIDAQVAALLSGPPARTLALAESCTAGLLAARLTEQPGASAYLLGGAVVYSNEAKTSQANVPAELVEAHGAVSGEVAQALAEGIRARFGADVGVGITGIAGPGGGSEEKPVGLVWVCVADAAGRILRSVTLPGSRADVRDRATTVAMHLLARLLRGEHDAP